MRLEVLLIGMLVSGCAATSGAYGGQTYFNQSERGPDFYRANVRVEEQADGVRVARGFRLDSGFDTAFLRSFGNAGGWNAHQLYVSYGYQGDWQFFQRAGMGGRPLEMIEIDRSVVSCYGYGGCSYREDFAAELSDADIRAGAETGLNVVFYAQGGGSVPITVSPEYVRGYAAAIGLMDLQSPEQTIEDAKAPEVAD